MLKVTFTKNWTGFNCRKYTTNDNNYGPGVMLGLGFILLWINNK